MRPNQSASKPLSISVVVLTADRPELLNRCLATIAAQTVKPKDVMIIDGSTKPHATRVITKRWLGKLPLAYRKDARHSIAAARNLGAAMSHGDLVIYLDDDLAADRNYLLRMRKHFVRDTHLAAVMGRITNALPENVCASTQYAYYERGLRQHFPSFKKKQKITSGRILDCEVMGIRRSIVTRIGFLGGRPFHFRHDDVELGLRLMATKASVTYDPAIVASAYPRSTLWSLWTAAFWNGYSDAYIEKLYVIDLRASPHPSKFLPWFWRQILSKSHFRVWEKIFYGLLLLSFPAVSRIGKLWCRLHI